MAEETMSAALATVPFAPPPLATAAPQLPVRVSPSLLELEQVIARSKKAYLEVGNALREMQERKLYRDAGYSTFESYCKERWAFSRSVGYDYINAANVAENVGLTLQNQPNFTQAVELSRLEPEQQ